MALNTPLMGAVDNDQECALVGAGSIFELSTLSAQFCCEPKALKKMKFIKKNFFKTRKALGYNFYLSSSVILDLPIT